MKLHQELNIRYSEPSEKLGKFIRQFIFMKQTDTEKIFADKYIPDGYISLVIHFGTKVYYFSNGEALPLPRLFLVVPLHQSLHILVPSSCDTLIVMFHTTMFTRLFNINLNRKRNTPFVSAENIFSGPELQKISSFDSDSQRINFIEEWVSQKVSIGKYKADEIDQIFDELMDHHGSCLIQSILQHKKIDPRTFRRKFLQRTGMNAKSLCRIARFHHLWSEFRTLGINDIQTMIYEGGFYDQAHMINDFKNFIGESPRTFFTRDQESVCFMSGKNI